MSSEPDTAENDIESCSEERTKSQGSELESQSEALNTDSDLSTDHLDEDRDSLGPGDEEYKENKDGYLTSTDSHSAVSINNKNSTNDPAEGHRRVWPSSNAERAGETVPTQERQTSLDPEIHAKLLG